MLEVQIYDDEGKSAVSGNALVRIPEEQSTKLVPIGNCYQLPVAMWPHDLLGQDTQKIGLLEIIKTRMPSHPFLGAITLSWLFSMHDRVPNNLLKSFRTIERNF